MKNNNRNVFYQYSDQTGELCLIRPGKTYKHYSFTNIYMSYQTELGRIHGRIHSVPILWTVKPLTSFVLMIIHTDFHSPFMCTRVLIRDASTSEGPRAEILTSAQLCEKNCILKCMQ